MRPNKEENHAVIWTGRGEEAANSIALSYKPVAEYVMAIEDLEN